MNNNFIPCQLKVNNSVSPLNVEGIPQFSWWCWSEASDQKQTAYQIFWIAVNLMSCMLAKNYWKVLPISGGSRFGITIIFPHHGQIGAGLIWESVMTIGTVLSGWIVT